MFLYKLKLFSYKAIGFYVLFFVNGILNTTAYAQKTITVTEFLAATKTAIQSKANEEALAYISNYNYNLPLIKAVQLRSETKQFQLIKQEYSMRISPNSIRAISGQKKVYQNKIERVIIENRIRFNEEIEKRYLQVIDYMFTNQLIDLWQEKQMQLMDKLKILKQNIYEINFDATDLVNVEDELLATSLKLMNLKDLKQRQLSVIEYALNFQSNKLQFNFDNLISPQQIIDTKIVKGFQPTNNQIKLQELKLNSLEEEVKLDVAKSNQLIDYFQVKFESSNDFLFDKNISVGIGINLPFYKKRQHKGDYYLDKYSTESKLVEQIKDEEFTQKQIIYEFENAIENFQINKTQTDKSSITSMLNIYKKMDGVSPLLLLKLKTLELKKKIETFESMHQLYSKYIKLLSNQETLFQQPYVNHLSALKEHLRP